MALSMASHMMPVDVLMLDMMLLLLLPCWLRSIKGLTVNPTDLSLSPCSSSKQTLLV